MTLIAIIDNVNMPATKEILFILNNGVGGYIL